MSDVAAGPHPADDRGSLGRSTLAMTMGTVVSRATGVVRLGVLAATLGVVETRLTDSYNLANTAPNILYELVLGGVIGAVFVPLFVEQLETREPEAARRTITGVFVVSLLMLAAIALAGVVLAPLIAGLYSGRLDGAEAERQREVITFLLRVFIPQVVLYGIYFIGSAIMNAHRLFVLPMWTPIVNNLILIGVLIAFRHTWGFVSMDDVTTTQLWVLGLGTTISVAPGGLGLLPSLFRLGIFRGFDVDRALMKRVVHLSAYVFGFVAVNQVTYVIMQWLANREQGGYTAYIAASTFFLLPIGLFVWSITTALAPGMSRRALRKDWPGFAADVSTAMRATLFVLLPSAVGLLVIGRPLIEVLLEHGVVTGESTQLIVDVLRFMVLGLVQYSLFLVLVRAFYATQDARTPFVINCAVVALNSAINFPMFAWLGVEGLAAGQAAAYTFGTILLLRALKKRAGEFDAGGFVRTTARLGAATLVMALATFLALEGVAAVTGEGAVGDVLLLVIPTVVGAGTYLGCAALLKVEEMDVVKRLVLRRGN